MIPTLCAHYTAVMLLGIAWMFDGIPEDILPGLQLYPAHLEREIAELSVEIRSKGWHATTGRWGASSPGLISTVMCFRVKM
jgi:hypothetical protein